MNEPDRLDDVDRQIYDYLNLDNPMSFLLLAGAGAGKTRTLINVLMEIKQNKLDQLIKNGQRVAVITYTNAACDEIKHRLNYDTMFSVSTIHKFVWELIKPFTNDIRNWLSNYLEQKISELENKIDRAKDKNGKTALENKSKLDKSLRRRDSLNEIDQFIYSPTELLTGKGSLNHSEVILIAADLLLEKPLLRKVLINRYPILLIDECQDTNKKLLESLINVQQVNKEEFSLGLIGDQMQSIYGGGKRDIVKTIPPDWKVSEKTINYRSPNRVIELINSIRAEDDEWKQSPTNSSEEGVIRLFVVDSKSANKQKVEAKIRQIMLKETGDDLWVANTFIDEHQVTQEAIKSLTLEHAMAATRGDFADFFLPLLDDDKLRDGALNGSRKEFLFILNVLVPFISAVKEDRNFDITAIIKLGSDYLSDTNLLFVFDPIECIKQAKELVINFKDLVLKGGTTLLDVLLFLKNNTLLQVPEEFYPYLVAEKVEAEYPEDVELAGKESRAWSNALKAGIGQVENYSKYVSGGLGFATHQGVKGLEFERVIAILDDEDSKGFLFKYEKLFGVDPLSTIDLKNEVEGKDTSLARVRRLFYVICSRAKKSLAVVAYTKDPEKLRDRALLTWFKESEIINLR